MSDLLKQALLKKYKAPLNTSKDCIELATEITNTTKRNVSEATLRRFLGLLKSKSSLSAYNLDTLSIYCGYLDFNDFSAKKSAVNSNSVGDNLNVKNEWKSITNTTLNSIALKSLVKFDQTIARKNINQLIDAFLVSNTSILYLTAPSGFGKSMALAHWIKSTKEQHVLFCSADYFQSLIKHKPLNNRLNTAINELVHANTNDKIIFVIDAFDEIVGVNNKAQTILAYFETLCCKHDNANIKVIISLHNNNYDKLIKESRRCVKSKRISEDFFRLSQLEIKQILEEPSDIIYDCLSWSVKQLIRIPLNLYLLQSVYELIENFEEVTQAFLLRSFFNQQIFKAKYAEQKEDILWAIIGKTKLNAAKGCIAKSTLKNIYPIHLKREHAYYSAYIALLNCGVVVEEREENKYGIFTTNTLIENNEFLYYLSALYQIKINQGIDSTLFLKIAELDNDTEWKAHVIAILFELAYVNEQFTELEHFYTLPEYLISHIVIRTTVGACFRIKNKIRDRLSLSYASAKHGQTYFIEQFVDVNYLFNNYTTRIVEYLKHKKIHEAQLFGNNIQFTSAILDLDVANCKTYFDKINEVPIDERIHPWPIGRLTANTILYQHFIDKQSSLNTKELIEKNRDVAFVYPGYLKKGVVEFELMIMVSLCIIGDFDTLYWLLNTTINSYNYFNDENCLESIMHSGQNSLLKVFKAFASHKLKMRKSEQLLNILITASNNYYSNIDDFQYRIMVYWLLCDYFNSESKTEESLKYWQRAYDLSRFANYKFYQVFLLVNKPWIEENDLDEISSLLKETRFKEVDFKISS